MSSVGSPIPRERPRVQAFVETISLRRAIGVVVVAALVVGAGGALLLMLVDRSAFEDFGDAVWLAVVTVTTVGFGDVVPTNTAGRLVTAVLALLGISLIPTLTSLVTAVLVTQYQSRHAEAQQAEQERVIAVLERLERRLEHLEGRSR
jgi:voltage-gated potassium channel